MPFNARSDFASISLLSKMKFEQLVTPGFNLKLLVATLELLEMKMYGRPIAFLPRAMVFLVTFYSMPGFEGQVRYL